MIGHALSLTGRLLGRGKLSILIYHQVMATLDPMRPQEPTADTFDWQMRLLSKHFLPLPLHEALKRLSTGTLPPNAVCVTFDDGYLNNLTVALPILQRHAIPATVYVATAYSEGRNMWNDRLYHLFSDPTRKRLLYAGKPIDFDSWDERISQVATLIAELKYLTPQERDRIIDDLYQENEAKEEAPRMMSPTQVKALSEAGVEIGAHTHRHPILLRISEEEQKQELQQSKSLLEQWTEKPVRHLAYPNGKYGIDFDEHAMNAAKHLGFESAVSTDWGISRGDVNQFRLPRFTPWDQSSLRFQTRLHLNQIRN